MQTLPARWGILGILLFCSCALEGEKTPLPEAAPVIAVLKAAKASDVAGFKNAYSKHIREVTEQGDWEKNLKEAQSNLKKFYGDYEIKDFGFTFTGDKEKGAVSLTHKGTKSITLKVIKEGKQWKLDER